MSISEKAMQGRDGFLFLNGRDANNLVDFLTGRESLPPAAAFVHQANRTAIGALGVPFLGIIVPEAHVVHADSLPHGITISEDRPVRQATQLMDERYVYADRLLAEFRAGGGTAYTGRDSHWTETAALHVWQALRGRVGRKAAFKAAYTPSDGAEQGDLGSADLRASIAAERRLQTRTGGLAYRTTHASGILNHGNLYMAFNPARDGRCLAFGTSFSNRLVPAIASDFRETAFCYGTTVDPLMVALVRPDCVVCEMPERFLHFPSLAVDGSTIFSLILGLPEVTDAVRPPLHDLPDEVARLPALFAAARADAEGLPGRSLMQAIEAAAPKVAHSVALLAPFLTGGGDLRALRRVMAGQFFTRADFTALAALVDSKALTVAQLPLMPPSECGRLVRIRILLRARLWQAARTELEALIATCGQGPDAAWYADFLKAS